MLKQYGDQLICVRYDKAGQKRLKTIEIIVDEQDWIPGVIFPMDKIVPGKIGFGKAGLREQMKQAGVYWNPEKKAWMLAYRRVLRMGLKRRVDDNLCL